MLRDRVVDRSATQKDAARATSASGARSRQVPVDQPAGRPPRKTTFVQKRSLWQITSPVSSPEALPLASSGGTKPDLGVVHPAEKAAELPDDVVGRGNRCERRLAFHVRQDLAALLVDAEKARCAVEADRSKWRSNACTAATTGRPAAEPCRQC